MASEFFDEIIESKLDKRFGSGLSRRQGSFRAEVAEAIKIKGLSLTAQFTLNPDRLMEENSISGVEASAEEAALIRVEELIEGIVRSSGQDKNTKSSGTVLLPSDRSRLYLAGGSEVSYSKLTTLLNIKLGEYIQDLMGEAGRLTWRTGRFSESAHINGISPQGSVYFNYMTAPYKVFEKGTNGRSPWNKGNRDPRDIIRIAIKKALLDTLNDSSASRLLKNIRFRE